MKALSHNKVAWLLLIVFLAMPMIGIAGPYDDAPTFTQIGQNLISAINTGYGLVQAIVCFIGFILVVMGMHGLYKVTKEKGQGQHSYGIATAGIIIGIFLVMLPLTVGTLGKTIFGADAKRPDRIDIAPDLGNP